LNIKENNKTTKKVLTTLVFGFILLISVYDIYNPFLFAEINPPYGKILDVIWIVILLGWLILIWKYDRI